MDTNRLLLTPSVQDSAADGAPRKACTVNLNKVTLVTLVIAVAGFASTAFAAAPVDCAVQAAVLAAPSV